MLTMAIGILKRCILASYVLRTLRKIVASTACHVLDPSTSLAFDANPTNDPSAIHPIQPLYDGLVLARQLGSPYQAATESRPEKWPVWWTDTPRRYVHDNTANKKGV